MSQPDDSFDLRGLPPLQIDTLEAGENFIAGIRLNDTLHASASIQRLLYGLDALPPEASVLLEILEKLRLPLRFVVEQLAHNYQDRALPLGEHENSAFQRAATLLSTLEHTYRLCAQPLADETTAERHALILHRSLDCATASLYEYFRARQQIPAGRWLSIHQLYATAETSHVADVVVDDPLQGGAIISSCRSVYLAALLTELSGPHTFAARDLDQVRYLSNLWSPMVSLLPLSAGPAPLQTVVSWTSDQPFCTVSGHTAPSSTRHLESGPLLQFLGEALSALQSGAPPSAFGMGETIPPLQARKFLSSLLRSWSLARAPRRFQRHRTHGVARIVDGFPAICFALTGRHYAPPDSNALYSRQEYETLYTFRHMVDPNAELSIHPCPPEFQPAEWEVLDESVTGFHLYRSGAGHRLAFRQLLGILPHDGHRYLLAHISRLAQGRDAALDAGLAMLPGLPAVVTVRALSEQERRSSVSQESAFHLSALPPLSQHPCLILPKGWYRHGRELRVLGENESMVVMLTELLFSGSDFDQVRYRVSS